MRKNMVTILIILAIAAIAIVSVENIGYRRVKTTDGVLYGKTTGNGKELVVLLVAGSGPTDMDGNTTLISGRNDSFLQLAKLLSKKGIPVFRYDKRISGRSSKTFNQELMDFDFFVEDCVSIVRYLKEKGYKKVIIAGHSQGSLVGMLTATKEPVDGFISLAGTGFPIDETLEKQLLSQFDNESKELQTIRTLREGNTNTWFDDNHPLFSLDKQHFILTWMKHKPADIITQLNIPVMIVHGDADTQVDINDYNALITGKSDQESYIIKNMNHLLKKVNTENESMASYSDPSFLVHESLIEIILQFVRKI